MHLFDEQVFELCKIKSISYTRYADDLFFSTNREHVLTELSEEIKNILNKLDYPADLILNTSKTVQTSKKFNRTVTGLILSNDANISIGRTKKRHWRMKAYSLSKKLDNLDRNNLPIEIIEEINSLKGYIAFLSGIDKKFADDLKRISGM